MARIVGLLLAAGQGRRFGADKLMQALADGTPVAVAAARALKSQLERTGRYKVVMTRDTDVYVDHGVRVQIARRADADLFISLHADSGPDATTRGASVYTLSEKGEHITLQRQDPPRWAVIWWRK